MLLAAIPPPPLRVIQLGPVPIRLYAVMIILGVLVAVWIGERRLLARGGRAGAVADVAGWAVPFGLVGARLYHVATNPELYFAAGRRPVEALFVWQGGLGIWGAVAGGALGAWIAARRHGVPFGLLADAAAPGLAVAQAIGRWGNYFNSELFGRPTDLPWALRVTNPADGNAPGLYHPTFLYESLWDLGVAGLVVWADRRYRLGRGRAFALYVASYTAGRAWIEALRIDPANVYGGLRVNEWVSIGVFAAAVAYLALRSGRREEAAPAGGQPVPDAPAARHATAAGERPGSLPA